MKILVAEEAGFCFGVKRALKLINEYLKKGKKIQTFGPLIQSVRSRKSKKIKPFASGPTAFRAKSKNPCRKRASLPWMPPARW
jgi:hypothetical protein